MIELGDAPRILITRLSAIGDCIHTLPMVAALRNRFPNAYLAWVTQSGPASLMQGLTGLNKIITVDRSWYKSWSSIQRVRQELRREQFTITIDPQSLTKSSMLGWLSGARYRVGFARGQGRELSPILSTHCVKPLRSHVVHRYLELLKPLGITHPQVRFQLPESSVAVSSMAKFLDKCGLNEFALLNPGAGWDSKRWPHERYGTLAKSLYDRQQIRSLILWAGPREKAWAEAIVAASNDSAMLAPDTSLPELAALCRRAKLFIGSDTGPMHLAAAVDTPCVAMYGPTRIAVCGPYGDQHESLQVYYQDGSSSERRGSDNSAMRAITEQMVCDACERVLAATRQRQRVA